MNVNEYENENLSYTMPKRQQYILDYTINGGVAKIETFIYQHIKNT